MRLWSIHPHYLDAKGLVACWREGLLARKVIQGETIGYKNHPQLQRFKNTANPLIAIDNYLYYILLEAQNRKYHFDMKKISINEKIDLMTVTSGQLSYEFNHLKGKLMSRDPHALHRLVNVVEIEAHPLFLIKSGDIESWETIYR